MGSEMCIRDSIDTAEMYGNEKDVGNALKDSGLKRDEIFVTTKLWDPDKGYDHALKAFDASMKKMNLEYLDLYLIHRPGMRSNLETWKALERIRKDGRCRSIGVSNFAPKHLNELLVKGNDRPAVNQIELNPFLKQETIASFCHKENIHLTGYCPLARGRRLDDPKLCQVAKQTKKTVAQVMIRWALQHGQSVIPKSVRPERIQETANVFDFNLNDEQMKILNGLEDGFRLCPDPMRIR